MQSSGALHYFELNELNLLKSRRIASQYLKVPHLVLICTGDIRAFRWYRFTNSFYFLCFRAVSAVGSSRPHEQTLLCIPPGWSGGCGCVRRLVHAITDQYRWYRDIAMSGNFISAGLIWSCPHRTIFLFTSLPFFLPWINWWKLTTIQNLISRIHCQL